MDIPHPVVAIAKVDQDRVEHLEGDLVNKDVYLVALMSKFVRMKPSDVKKAGGYFPKGSMIMSGEPIFLETRCDLSLSS